MNSVITSKKWAITFGLCKFLGNLLYAYDEYEFIFLKKKALNTFHAVIQYTLNH